MCCGQESILSIQHTWIFLLSNDHDEYDEAEKFKPAATRKKIKFFLRCSTIEDQEYFYLKFKEKNLTTYCE